MPSCPTIHEHPSFKIPTKNSKYPKLIKKLKRFLKSDSGHAIGEYKRYELSPFKGFPKGSVDERCLFLLCKDCKKEVMNPLCKFCGSNKHSMNDAVLVVVGNHKEVYGKKGTNLIKGLKGE